MDQQTADFTALVAISHGNQNGSTPRVSKRMGNANDHLHAIDAQGRLVLAHPAGCTPGEDEGGMHGPHILNPID
jgi:hypothetical protein